MIAAGQLVALDRRKGGSIACKIAQIKLFCAQAPPVCRLQIRHSHRRHTDHAAGGKIQIQKVFAAQDQPHFTRFAARRAVALHTHHGIHHRHIRLHRLQQIDQHTAKALAIAEACVPFGLLQAGNAAEQVFHRACVARHHMGFQLGQVNDKIRLQHRLDQAEFLHQFPVGFPNLPLAAGVALDALGPARLFHAAGVVGRFHQRGIVHPAHGIRQHDLAKGHPAPVNRADHRRDHRRVRGHRVFGGMLGQQVGLEQHMAASPQPPGCRQGRKNSLYGAVDLRLIIAIGSLHDHRLCHVPAPFRISFSESSRVRPKIHECASAPW